VSTNFSRTLIYVVDATSKFLFFFFFSSRRRHTRSKRDWSSDVCSSDLVSKPSEETQQRDSEDTADNEESKESYTAAEHCIMTQRSEERRVGKECRSRGGADH